jgi:hypothetical protein
MSESALELADTCAMSFGVSCGRHQAKGNCFFEDVRRA